MIDNDFLFHWSTFSETLSDNIIVMAKNIIEKSIQTNNTISSITDTNKIIALLADDMTLCQSLHSIFSFLNFINNSSKKLRKSEILLLNHEAYLNSRLDIYDKLVSIKQNNKLANEDLQFINELITCYKKNGIDLTNNNKILLKKLDDEIINVKTLIVKHTNDSEHTTINVPYDDLEGMPLHIINTFENVDCDTVKIKLNLYNYKLCITHINKEKVKQNIRNFYCKNKYEKIIGQLAKVIVLRDRRDKLLSFNNHSEYVLSSQMCKNTEQVQYFLKKMIDLTNSKGTNTCPLGALNKWSKENGYNNDAVKEYFEINDVISKIIKIYEMLFSVKFVKLTNVAKWSNDLLIFAINKDQNNLGYLYLDLFGREGKHKQMRCFCLQSACMYPIMSGKYIKPIITLCSSFDKFKNGLTLLNYDEVVSIFHEFGHVIHHIFGKTKYIIFSGTNVEQDFVEVPVQILEMLCYEPHIIKYLSNHYIKKKEKMSDNLINRIIQYNTMCTTLNYKKHLLNATFDQIICSSGKFVQFCEECLLSNDVENLKTAFMLVYEQIFKNIMTNSKLTNKLLPYDIGQIICDYDGKYYNDLWSKKIAKDLYDETVKGKELNGLIGNKMVDCIFKFGGTNTGFEMCNLYVGKDLMIRPLNQPIKAINVVNDMIIKNDDTSSDEDCTFEESVSNNFCEIIDD